MLKGSLFADDTIVFTENLKQSIKNKQKTPSELMSEFSKIIGKNMANIQNQSHFYMLATNY